MKKVRREDRAARRSSNGTSRKWAALALCIGGPLAVGALSGAATMEGVRTWYQGLVKPAFNPPDWIFGPVWTALYIAMGAAAYLVWRYGAERQVVRAGLVWFVVQLIANGAWSLIFFGMQNPGLAFAEILVLLGLIIWTTRLFWSQSKIAGALMVPYIAWVGFATILNFSIWRLNG